MMKFKSSIYWEWKFSTFTYTMQEFLKATDCFKIKTNFSISESLDIKLQTRIFMITLLFMTNRCQRPPVCSYTNWNNLGNKSQTPLSTMYHEFIKYCCWLVKEKPYDTKGGNPSGNEWNCALTVRLPLCGRVALLERNTPGSARRERFTQSSLSMPSADGMLNEAIGQHEIFI